MAMTVLSTTDLSDYGSRSVTVEVVGSRGMKRTAVQTMTVPYTRLSHTIQTIHRLGGKISQVTLLSASESVAQTLTTSQPQSAPSVVEVRPSDPKPRRARTSTASSTTAQPSAKTTPKPSKSTPGQRSKRKSKG